MAPNKVTVVTGIPTRSMTINVFQNGAPYASFVAPIPGPVEIDCIGCDGAAVCIDADGCAGDASGLSCVYVTSNGNAETVNIAC